VLEHRGQRTRTGESVEPNSMGEQGSASLRRHRRDCAPSWIALHFWLTASKMSMPFLPPTGSWDRGHNHRIWHPPIMLYLPFSSGPLHPPLPLTTALCNPFPSFLFFYSSVQYTSSAIVLFSGRKPATRVHSRSTSLFREMLYLSSAIAAIHHANTAENCQIAPQLLHPTAQGTRRAGTDSS
jgi:hypothetical protein